MKDLTLEIFLKDFPHISIASEENNQEILDFYHQNPMSSSKSQIHYLRGDNFFSFLKERSHHFLVLILRDDQKQIQGLGVISFRPGYINNKLITVGYLGDLRVRLNRKLIREYRSMYAALIKASPNMPETHFCKFYQTVLIDSNQESQNNLSSNKIPNLYYDRLRAYKMINIWGRIQWPRLYQLFFTIKKATLDDRESILKFLESETNKSNFNHDWNSELDQRLKYWNSFDYSNILLVHNAQNELCALTMTWNPIKTKQVTISKVSPLIKLAHALIKNLPFFEVKNLPRENEAIDILYLHQFTFKKELTGKQQKMIVHEIINSCFKLNFKLLAYADFANEKYLENTFTYLNNTLSMALYSVHFKNPEEGVLNPIDSIKDKESLGFDMSLV